MFATCHMATASTLVWARNSQSTIAQTRSTAITEMIWVMLSNFSFESGPLSTVMAATSTRSTAPKRKNDARACREELLPGRDWLTLYVNDGGADHRGVVVRYRTRVLKDKCSRLLGSSVN